MAGIIRDKSTATWLKLLVSDIACLVIDAFEDDDKELLEKYADILKTTRRDMRLSKTEDQKTGG